MRTRLFIVLTSVTALAAAILAAQSSNGPYKVLKSARVRGEGGWDYIYAAAPATDARGAVPASPTRVQLRVRSRF